MAISLQDRLAAYQKQSTELTVDEDEDDKDEEVDVDDGTTRAEEKQQQEDKQIIDALRRDELLAIMMTGEVKEDGGGMGKVLQECSGPTNQNKNNL